MAGLNKITPQVVDHHVVCKLCPPTQKFEYFVERRVMLGPNLTHRFLHGGACYNNLEFLAVLRLMKMKVEVYIDSSVLIQKQRPRGIPEVVWRELNNRTTRNLLTEPYAPMETRVER